MGKSFVAALVVAAALSPGRAVADHVTSNPVVVLELGGDYLPMQSATPALVRWNINCSESGAGVQNAGAIDLMSAAGDQLYSQVVSNFVDLPASGSQEVLLPSGLAVYPHGHQIGCSVDAGGLPHADTKAAADGEVLVVPPRVNALYLLDLPGGNTYAEGTAPAGVELTVTSQIADTRYGDESVTVVFRGAGVDYVVDFEDPDAAMVAGEIKVTATEAGTLEHYVIKQPYGVESNRVTFEITGGAPDGGGADGGAADGGSGDGTSGGAVTDDGGGGCGCSGAGNGVAVWAFGALALLGFAARRRQ